MIKDLYKSLAVTGHRILEKNFDRDLLKKELLNLVEIGFNKFYVGMALGFDTECFLILEKIREEKDIKIIACIPCVSQSEKFNKKQKELYKKMINNSDEIVIVQENYDEFCMKKRNKYMVDNSSAVLAYLNRSISGTYQTVKYAIENDKKIYYFKNGKTI